MLEKDCQTFDESPADRCCLYMDGTTFEESKGQGDDPKGSTGEYSTATNVCFDSGSSYWCVFVFEMSNHRSMPFMYETSGEEYMEGGSAGQAKSYT